MTFAVEKEKFNTLKDYMKKVKKKINLFYLLISLPFIFYIVKENPIILDSTIENFNRVEKIKIERVIDGDTILVSSQGTEKKIRLYGIDTPELSQKDGESAKQYIQELLPQGTETYIEIFDIDQYGRSVALVQYNDNTTIQEALLSYGLAWYYPEYCKKSFCTDWQKIESQAKQNNLGLWQNETPINPSEFRR